MKIQIYVACALCLVLCACTNTNTENSSSMAEEPMAITAETSESTYEISGTAPIISIAKEELLKQKEEERARIKQEEAAQTSADIINGGGDQSSLISDPSGENFDIHESQTEYQKTYIQEFSTDAPSIDSIGGYTETDLYWVGRVIEAEYSNGTELDKRYIAACIFNRTECPSGDFAGTNTVYEVVVKSGQFHLGGEPTLETMNAVYKEAQERTDYRILWFNNGNYLPYGEQLFSANGHYFSGYEWR